MENYIQGQKWLTNVLNSQYCKLLLYGHLYVCSGFGDLHLFWAGGMEIK